MIVCKRCLMAIESHEGPQAHKKLDWFSIDEELITCEWCEEDYEPDELYEI